MPQSSTVLIVEDDPVFRRVMNFTIARCGFTVETASDGKSAYHRLCNGGIDFLVTDHQMPICTGLELLEMIEENESLISPPTILCTAKGLELDSQGLQSRFNLVTVMHKPFSPRKLSELILQHIPAGTPAPPLEIPTAFPHSEGAVDG